MAMAMKPPVALLERMESHPSLTYSTSSEPSDPITPMGQSENLSNSLLTPASPTAEFPIASTGSFTSPSPYEQGDASERFERLEIRPEYDRGRKPAACNNGSAGKLHWSRSTQGLRAKSKEKKEKEVKESKESKESKKSRQRSVTLSDARASPPLPNLSSMPPAAPIPIPQPGVSKTPRSSSGFSSFLKKFKPRSSSQTPSQTSVSPPQAAPPRQQTQPVPKTPRTTTPTEVKGAQATPVDRSQMRSSRKRSSSVTRSAPMVEPVSRSRRASDADTSSRPASLVIPFERNAPTIRLVTPTEPTESSFNGRQSMDDPSNRLAVDPAQIPLPLSPLKFNASPKTSHEDLAKEFTKATPANVFVEASASPLKRHSASYTLSTSALTSSRPKSSDEEEAVEEMEEIEDDGESGDVVQPLPSLGARGLALEPLQIPDGGKSTELSSATSMTSTGATLEGEMVMTPNSAMPSFSPATSPSKSPPKYDPIVDASMPTGRNVSGDSKLSRKESKWRQSIMALGLDTSRANKPTRKPSTREPPTSYDAYISQQRRIASGRAGCAPTIHNAASVAAETREMANKDEQDMAETFFCS